MDWYPIYQRWMCATYTASSTTRSPLYVLLQLTLHRQRLHLRRPAARCQLPDKQCASDPLPTRLLKYTVDLLAPFITTLFNKSLASGMFPAVFKSAYITPRLKKASLDPADVKSYRPISNLPVLSKTLERLVAHQLVEHLNLWRLLPDAQSAYRANHSTETAVLRVLSDILAALDRGDFAY